MSLCFCGLQSPSSSRQGCRLLTEHPRAGNAPVPQAKLPRPGHHLQAGTAQQPSFALRARCPEPPGCIPQAHKQEEESSDHFQGDLGALSCCRQTASSPSCYCTLLLTGSSPKQRLVYSI